MFNTGKGLKLQSELLEFESRADHQGVFGSGRVSWFPNPDVEFNLSYGDHPVGGTRALMLGSKIDLSGS